MHLILDSIICVHKEEERAEESAEICQKKENKNRVGEREREREGSENAGTRWKKWNSSKYKERS